MSEIRDSLIGAPGRKLARGNRYEVAFEKARFELERLRMIPNSWWRLEPVFESAALDARLQRRGAQRSPRPFETTLDYAIRCGADAGHDESKRYQAGGLAERISHNLTELRPTGCVQARLEDHAFISLKPLREQNWLEPGYIIAYRLKWPRELTDKTDILMIVDTREPSPRLVFEFSREALSAPYHQTILIVSKPSMPGREFLVCPITGRESQQLFLRDGFFASRIAHSLKHRSQLA